MKNPYISIIMPCYNSEMFISKTIDSVINQTYINFELLIVDDNSSDSTIDIIKKYIKMDSRIKLFESPNNFGGPAKGRNIGIKNSKYDYLAFIDSDDLWHLKKLEIQIQYINKFNPDFISTGRIIFKENYNSEILNDYGFNFKKITYFKLLFNNSICCSSVLLKKKIIKPILFDEERKLISHEDYRCWLEIHKKINHSIEIPHQLVFYRISDNQISGSNFFGKLKRVRFHYYQMSTHENKYFGKFSFIAIFFVFTHNLISLLNVIFGKYK